MSKKFPNLAIGLVVIAVLAVASLQGRRLDHLRDSERFYRWILSACTQVRIFGIPGTVIQPDSQDRADEVDIQLFQRLVEESEVFLDDVPVAESDYDKDGEPFPKVVRYTSAPLEAAEMQGGEEERGQIESEEQERRDWELWRMARSNELAPLRADFVSALRDGRLTSSGSQFNLSGLYEERGTSISLANMFLGFRKMAANLIWLQVDKLWHQGSVHRMIPMMRTVVTLDPTFIDAFLVGAWHLAYNITAQLDFTPYELRTYKPEYQDWVGEREDFYYAGVEFLKDGIRKNPRNYKLYFDLGFGIYEEKLENIPKGIEYLSEAIRLDHDRWVRRQLYRQLGEVGRYEESKAGWESYLEWQPDNKFSPRFIQLMDGAIKERDANWASVRARAAEDRAALASEQGDEEQAREWSAKAQEAREIEAQRYEEARQYWQGIVDESGGDEMYALTRMLVLSGREKVQQERYVEAIVDFDRARWASDQFWDECTRLMLDTKLAANEPLAATEQSQLDREANSEQYVRHLPKTYQGEQYEFNDGTWYESAREARETVIDIQRGSAEMYELIYEHPEAGEPIEELDGDIVLQAGDAWYRIDSAEPALASRLYTPPAA
ncbi:MAG: hypothetical protein AMXMBFR82_13310 [Candidatus Hydrogenedentota bacterium]